MDQKLTICHMDLDIVPPGMRRGTTRAGFESSNDLRPSGDQRRSMNG